MIIGQPRLWSAIEVVTDHAFGSLLATPFRMLLFPWFGLHFSTDQHLMLTVALFLLSLGRSFVSRRLFNWWNISKYRSRHYVSDKVTF